MKLKDVVKDFDNAVNTEEEIEQAEKSDKMETETAEETVEVEKEETIEADKTEDEVEPEVEADKVEDEDSEVEKSDKEEDKDEDKEETEDEKKKRKKKEKEEKKKSEEDKEDKEDEAEKSEETEESEEVFKNSDMVGFLQNVLKSYENTREELVSVKKELEVIKGLFVKEDLVDEINKSDEGVVLGDTKAVELDGETAIEKSEKSEEEAVAKAETTAPKTKEVDGVAKSEDGEADKEGYATKNATNVDNLEEAVKSEEVSKSDDESDEALVDEIEKNFMEKFQNDIRDSKVSKNEQYELRRAYIDMKNGQVEGNVDRLMEYLGK